MRGGFKKIWYKYIRGFYLIVMFISKGSKIILLLCLVGDILCKLIYNLFVV